MRSGIPNKDGLVPPQGVGTERRKKAYPPIQWRPLRVMNPWHKFAILVAWWVVAGVVRWGMETVVPPPLVTNVWIVVETFAIIAFARSCRGWGEPVAPARPWWRLTARPLLGWWFAALYLVSAASPISHGWDPGLLPLGITNLFLGLAFLNSSIRLTIVRRRGR